MCDLRLERGDSIKIMINLLQLGGGTPTYITTNKNISTHEYLLPPLTIPKTNIFYT